MFPKQSEMLYQRAAYQAVPGANGQRLVCMQHTENDNSGPSLAVLAGAPSAASPHLHTSGDKFNVLSLYAGCQCTMRGPTGARATAASGQTRRTLPSRKAKTTPAAAGPAQTIGTAAAKKQELFSLPQCLTRRYAPAIMCSRVQYAFGTTKGNPWPYTSIQALANQTSHAMSECLLSG